MGEGYSVDARYNGLGTGHPGLRVVEETVRIKGVALPDCIKGKMFA